MKKTTKILAVLLSLCMLAAFLPASSVAANGDTYAVFNAGEKTLTFCVGTLTDAGVVRDAGGDPVQGDAYYTGFLDGGVPWSEAKNNIQKAVFLDVIAPTTTASWFSGCYVLKKIENLPLLDTSNVTTMRAMFSTERDGCPVESLDLSNFNTEKVTDMSDMFMGCTRLTELDVSSFNTSNVTNMNGMFHSCASLRYLDLHTFDTRNVTNMGYMFTLCMALESVNLSSFDTSKVESMRSLFVYCQNLRSLDLSNFNTANVTTMRQMFYLCGKLSTLTIGEDFRFLPEELGLPDVPDDGYYTGRWVCNGLRCTSAQLTANYYGAAMTGTWVWDTGAATSGIDLSGAIVNVEDQSYTGDALTPPVTVTLNGTTLTENTDYSLLYNNNVGPGTATAIAIGIGDYAGAASANFNITRSLSGACVSASDQTYSGSALTPYATVTLDGDALSPDTDYDLVYVNNTDVGAATMIITGKGYYEGMSYGTFRISGDTPVGPAKTDLSDAVVSAADQTYTGNALTPEITVTLYGNTLYEGTDFTVKSYERNTEVGTAVVFISGVGDYEGIAYGTFLITGNTPVEPAKTDLSDSTVEVYDQEYSGEALTPDAFVSLYGSALREGTDYRTVYVNNTQPGTAVVIIAGVGDYTGMSYSTFQISDENTKDPDGQTDSKQLIKQVSVLDAIKRLFRSLFKTFGRVSG